MSIKYKFILGIVLILNIAMLSLAVVSTRQSEKFLVEALEDKVKLLNRNFSIVAGKGIQESTFSHLQDLINEVAAKDREIKTLVVAYPNRMVIATSDQEQFRQFSRIQIPLVLEQMEKKEEIILRNKPEKQLESISFIFSRQDEGTAEQENLTGFIYIILDMSHLEQSVSNLWTYSSLLSAFMIGLGIIAAYGFGTAMSRPIQRLAQDVRVIASGNLEKSIQPRSRDEIGQLASDVEKMRMAIKAMTENLKEQERLKKEMELARKIQTSLLPKLIENIHPDLEITAEMLPADQVGGDFYDVTLDRSGFLWLAIGDVSGHGVTPGLIMMMAQTVHTTVTTNLDCDAKGVVITINNILYKNVHERLNENHFMTFTALKYLEDGYFQHAGAHLSMIIFRRKTGSCELIKTNGIYLNFKRDISKGTKNSEFILDPGDTLVLYTDGLTEAQNQNEELLDIDRFMKIVEKHVNQDVEAMKDMIMADVIKWCDNNRLDDMSIVIVRRKI